VVVPPFLKAGLSLANYSMVETLIPSSFSTRTSVTFPSLSLIYALIGRISSLKSPAY
jgi:hypothetical protein